MPEFPRSFEASRPEHVFPAHTLTEEEYAAYTAELGNGLSYDSLQIAHSAHDIGGDVDRETSTRSHAAFIVGAGQVNPWLEVLAISDEETGWRRLLLGSPELPSVVIDEYYGRVVDRVNEELQQRELPYRFE
jgi:hypothetical protein